MDDQHQVQQSWGRIVRWFQTHAPRALQHLYGPVAAHELAAAEQELGMAFPAALQALYQMHDGEDGTVDIFPDRYRLLPVADCVQYWRWQKENANPRDHDLSEHAAAWHDWVAGGTCRIDGPVKPLAGSARWLPVLATPDGDPLRFLDFDPAPGGTAGQLIEVDLECCSWRVIVPSFLTFVHNYVDMLEQGSYRGTKGGVKERHPNDHPPITPMMPDYLRDVVIELYDSALAGVHPFDGADGKEDAVLYGAMGMLMGTSRHTIFSLHIPGHAEQHIVATPAWTYGYSAIRIRQYARVRVTRYTGQGDFPDMGLADPPVISWVALEYTKLQ
jgi:cell wall assembly regulator SMI1